MRKAVIVTLFTLAWMIGPVVRIEDAPLPPAPEPAVTTTIGG